MKIKGTIQQEFEIGEWEQQCVAMAWLYKKFNWNSNYFIKDDVVYENAAHHVDVNIEVRKATNDDIVFSNFLKSIRNHFLKF